MQHIMNAHNTVQNVTVQYSTVQYSTVQYSTVQYSAVQYSTAYVMIFSDLIAEKEEVWFYDTLPYQSVRFVVQSGTKQNSISLSVIQLTLLLFYYKRMFNILPLSLYLSYQAPLLFLSQWISRTFSPNILAISLYNSIQFNSIQFNSVQFNSIQFNSIQFNSIQFSSVQFSSI